MELTGFWKIYFVCFIGGFLNVFLELYENRKKPFKEVPVHFKLFFYWAMMVTMSALCALLPSIYGLNKAPCILILQLGASGPLIIKELASHTLPTRISSKLLSK